jgi:acetyl-CoA carboxylase biotin carboxyl carrier protein
VSERANEVAPASATTAAGEDSLLTLIDRLAVLVDEAGLAELEIEVGETTVAVRTAAAIAATPGASAGMSSGGAGAGGGVGAADAGRSVKAPLTGIWYSAPTPGSAPYVTVGAEIGSGQVVGLIEAMKLFNEIKSDLAGRVTRVLAENGQLVKARQPLIEVEPL